MGEVRTAGLSWDLGSGCVYKRPEGTLVYSVHEPAMLSALLSGYKKGPETGSGVGGGASGSGSGLTGEEPDGTPPLGQQHLPFYCSDSRTSGSDSSPSTLEVIQRWWGPGESVWWERGAVHLSGEKVLMQNCGPAPDGPQILAQTRTWTSCTMWKPCTLGGGSRFPRE